MNADFQLKQVGSACAKNHLHDLARMVEDENTAVTVERYGKPCAVMLGPAHLENPAGVSGTEKLQDDL